MDQGTIDVCEQGMNRHVQILTILSNRLYYTN